jgi:hypothetical protein
MKIQETYFVSCIFPVFYWRMVLNLKFSNLYPQLPEHMFINFYKHVRE